MNERGFFLNGVDPELPPCFEATCRCGWKGRFGQGFGWTVGVCGPLAEQPYDLPCPGCGKKYNYNRMERRLSFADLRARFRFAVERLGGWIRRDEKCFPCRCDPAPACKIVGDVSLNVTLMGDTVFCCDYEYLRLKADVACLGCGTRGPVAWVEMHGSNHCDSQPWWRELRYASTHRCRDGMNLSGDEGEVVARAKYERAVDGLPDAWRAFGKHGRVSFVGVRQDPDDLTNGTRYAVSFLGRPNLEGMPRTVNGFEALWKFEEAR